LIKVQSKATKIYRSKASPMKRKQILIFIFLILLGNPFAFSQNGVPVNGVSDNFEGTTAFINCTLIKDPQTKVERATLVIVNGKISNLRYDQLPADAKIIDLQGKWVYPSFIDVWSHYGIPKAPTKSNDPGPQFLSSKKGTWYWNEAIHPEVEAKTIYTSNFDEARALINLGFGMVASHQQNGISRGTGVLTALGSQSERNQLINENIGNFFSFNKGNSTQDYPSSLMGSIALLRQFNYDSKWFSDQLKKNVNFSKEDYLSLLAYESNKSKPHFFDVSDVQDLLRADKLGDEFGIQYTIKGNGDEYQFLTEVKNSKAPLIITLNFPDAYDVEDPFDARLISLTEMKHWEMAPFNPAILYQNGIDFAFTLNGLKKQDKFWPNLRKAIENGLPEEYALKALTINPAKFLNTESSCGTLEPGKLANFIITDGNIFKEETTILENWVLGKSHPLVDWNNTNYTGNYKIIIQDSAYEVNISGKSWQPKGELIPKAKGEFKVSLKNGFLNCQLLLKNKPPILGTAYKTGNDITLVSNDSNGRTFSMLLKFVKTNPEPIDSQKKDRVPKVPNYSMPWQYEKVSPTSFVISNCTVWTCDNLGNLENTDVFVSNGKIANIGKNLNMAGIVKIDGTGKHLTPGIIDEHSHIAISKGVNEGTQSITSEVRIQDVINAKDVNIYRQLSGGVTSSHLLHGSANAIGGQTALIKLKYGGSADVLKFPTDHKFIKFALGENVKQSNWGDNQTTRFPQSRMGVEQVFYDGFTRAQAYAEVKKTIGYRTDLELEALLEILNSKRFITCHSYVQSEINMLMHVADTFGFKVNTFTHILEGYKVADKMKRHGAAASTFSDWWAYKYEVADAIPHNAAILSKAGVLTGINSDDAEMGRRLNQEAAKSIKYSDMSEVDALNMVTINPAKMLHIDQKVGSIAIGKDADLVIWDGPPLSSYSKVVTTFIEGKIYFDRTEDLITREQIAKERQRLIDMMIKAKKTGQSTQKAAKTFEEEYHCEDDE
jgi:imidazolonepropionase-like amidohydrolase